MGVLKSEIKKYNIHEIFVISFKNIFGKNKAHNYMS